MRNRLIDRARGTGRSHIRSGLITIAMASLLGGYGNVEAFEIPTGHEDFKANWDNSIRYNLGYRVGEADSAILANPDLDDGERNFKDGIVTSRLDLLSELDVSYKKAYGFRFSGAGWYDPAYAHGLHKDQDTSNARDSNGNAEAINSYTKRYYLGPSGELLDAFAFAKFEIAEIPVQLKVGRNTQFWGEGLGFNAALNGISYAQMPIDVAKAYAVPNTGAKELFRPLNNISVTANPTSTLTLMAQYFLEWEPNRYPEAGSYMAPYDYLFNGGIGDQQFFAFGLTRGNDIKPKDAGDWGVGLRWSPEVLNGTTFGLYYRNFSDKMPQAHADIDTGQLRFAYADDIDLYGLSYSQQVLGVSVGGEFSYRRNMPLLNQGAAVTTAGLPGGGDVATARGDTLHALINFLGLINRTPLFDSAQWIVEFNWGNYLKVTEDLIDENNPNGTFMGYGSYTDINRATKDFVSLDLNFAPTWFEVLPGANLTVPLYYGRGIHGNSPTNIIQKDAGSWSAGASIDYLARHKFDLLYVDYFGEYRTDPATGAVAANNGDPALLKDRGTVSFTYRYTF